jgi:pilus assembly protein CpaB
MNRRVLVIVLCALVLSITASYLVYQTVSAHVSTEKAAPTIQLIVAARDLAAGTLIHKADLKMATWMGPAPQGSLRNRDGFLNRGVAAPIYEGEPVTENRMSPKGSGGGLAATIPPGMRACAIRVNEVVGVAGFVVPGMRVDVLITGLPPGGNAIDGPRVRTLLQNIEVLSAGTNFQKNQEGKPEQVQVVNLLVTPAQAEILSLAGNETHIQLVLRNPMDTEISKPPGTAMSDLFGGGHAAEPARSDRPATAATTPHPPVPIVAEPAPPVLYTIEVTNGAVHTEPKFIRPPGKP